MLRGERGVEVEGGDAYGGQWPFGVRWDFSERSVEGHVAGRDVAEGHVAEVHGAGEHGENTESWNKRTKNSNINISTIELILILYPQLEIKKVFILKGVKRNGP